MTRPLWHVLHAVDYRELALLEQADGYCRWVCHLVLLRFPMRADRTRGLLVGDNEPFWQVADPWANPSACAHVKAVAHSARIAEVVVTHSSSLEFLYSDILLKKRLGSLKDHSKFD